jgi:hypothetical protein
MDIIENLLRESLENSTKAKEVYILFKYGNYVEKYLIINCFKSAKKVANAVKEIMEYAAIKEEEISNLKYGDYITTNTYESPNLQIEKYLLL